MGTATRWKTAAQAWASRSLILAAPAAPKFNGIEKGGKVNNMQLPYGSYTVVELNPPEGRDPIKFEVFHRPRSCQPGCGGAEAGAGRRLPLPGRMEQL